MLYPTTILSLVWRAVEKHCVFTIKFEILYEFVAEEELEQSGEQDSIIVPVRHNVVLDDNNLLEGIINAFERIQFLLTFSSVSIS